jgi:hypothetical protein
LITETDSLFHDKLGFVFFFQPKNKKEMTFIINKNNFDYPIFIDKNNSIDKLNHFPQAAAYQCFLLDKDNKVLLIGNPMLNQNIWELYKQQILKDKQTVRTPLTTINPDKMVYNYSTIRKGNRYEVVFTIENTGNQSLFINRVNTSCGCTNADWDKQPVEPGQTAKIKVEMIPEETGYFNKTIEVYGNFELSPVKLTITGMVTE